MTPKTTRELASVFNVSLLSRYQVAALAATALDFGVMILLVEIAHLSSPIATVISAICGGIANFTLSRLWAYHTRHDGTLFSQASRYGVVSLGGALLNGVFLALLLRAVVIPYVIGRLIVSLCVSVFYTYPLHTRVVFRVGD